MTLQRLLRQIGAAARGEIERMVGGRIYLDIRVKVREGWRQSERDVRRLGYGSRG